jgi:predicted dehydrogenase
MSKPLKIGIVGAGSIGIRGALDHLVLPDVQDRVVMTAVCDPAPGRAKAAAEKYRVPRYFESFEDLLAKGDVEAVTLGSPIGVHFGQGMKAVRAGKHVHFNKTMTTTSAEADQLIAEAQAHKVWLVASPGEMLRPHNRHIRELLGDGVLGQLAWAVIGCAFGSYHEKEKCRQGEDALSNINPAWYWQKAAGGGPLYDMTVYGLHALTGILGPAKRVTAFSGVALKEREFRGQKFACDCHDNTVMLLDFGNTFFAFVYGTFAGTVTRFANPNFYGAKGSIVGLELNGKPIPYPGREEAEQAKQGYNVLLPHVRNTPHREMEEAHVFEDIMQLVDLVREGKPTPATPEHARHVIEIIGAAYRAAETGQTQALRTAFDGI